MWALYAGIYNGICIGYNIDDSTKSFMPKKIEFYSEYGNKIIPSDIHEVTFEQIQYDNIGDHPLKIFSNKSSRVDNIIYNLIHKKECWISEKEYRAIIHETEYDIHSIENKTLKIFYEDNLLDEIIFGYRVNQETMNAIIQIIKNKYNTHIRLYKIEADLTKYCLIKKEIHELLL
jgi:hypothetical protein